MADFEQNPDTLRSEDTVEAILAISEGPIHGLVDGAKSFLVGDTPLKDVAGNANFDGVTLKQFKGTAEGETIKPILGGVAGSSSVGVTLVTDVPVVRTGTLQNIDYLEVRLVFSQLLKQKKSGVHLDNCTIRIEYKATSSPSWQNAFAEDLVIRGKTTSTYVKEVRWSVLRIAGTYDIRVTKLDPPEGGAERVCQVAWESFQQVVKGSFSFPNTALVQVAFRASNQISSVPQLAGIYKGRQVRVPSNYDAVARTYSGLWDGTFITRWTDDPTWILYDFVTNDRYGLSAYNPTTMDKWDVYEASLWCSAQVPDGEGGTHPRHSFNHIIAEARSGKEMARFIAGTFGGIFLDDGQGVAVLKVDRPTDAAHLFTPDNVVDGRFEYSYSDISSRKNDFTVSFINPNLDWQEDRRRVFDQDAIDTYGRTPEEFVAVGVTNAQEAIRAAKRKLISGLTEKCTVTFRTNRLGQQVGLYDIVLIGDPRMGWSTGGRVTEFVSGQPKRFRFRDPISVEIGIDYRVKFEIPNPAYPATSDKPTTLWESAVAVTSPRGVVKELRLVDDLPSLPLYATFTLEQDGAGYGLPKPFRVLSIEEVEGDPDNFQITALEHNRLKYDFIDGVAPIQVPDYSFHETNNITPPTDLAFSLTSQEIDGFQSPVLNLKWSRSTSKFARRYKVDAKWKGGTVVELGTTTDNEFEIVDPPTGDHTFFVYAQSFTGGTSAPLVGEYGIAEETRVVPPPSNLRVWEVGGTSFSGADLHVEWDQAIEDPVFLRYRVDVIHSVTDAILQTFHTTKREFFYTFEANRQGHSTASRNVKIRVVAQDWGYNDSAPVTVVFTNPAPAVPNNVVINGVIAGFHILFDESTEVDVIGYRIWASQVSGFTPSTANQIYDGPTNFYRWEKAGKWYFKLAAYDIFRGSLNISGEFTATAGDVVKEGQITAAMIAAGALDATKFAADVSPVKIVDVLPDPVNYVGPSVVLLKTDHQLYRLANGAWTKAVEAVDVNGQLTAEQIADAAIVAGKIAAGAIIAGKIAAGVVTANELAANSVVAGKIAAGAVSADQLVAGAVSAEKLAAGAVTTKALAVGDFTNLIPDGAFQANNLASWTLGTNPDHLVVEATNDPIATYAIKLKPGAVTHADANAAPAVCKPGDQFFIQWDAKAGPGTVSASARIRWLWNRADGTFSSSSRAITPTTAWATYDGDLVITAPADAVSVTFRVARDANSDTADVWFTNIQARRINDAVLIKDGAVVAAKLAVNSVTAAAVAANAITADKIGAEAVTTVKLSANAVTAAKIAVGAITAEKLAAGSVTAGAIEAGAVVADKIQAGAVSSDKIQAGAITARELAVGDYRNLITNGSFANDSLKGWELVNPDAIAVSEQPASGTRYAILFRPGMDLARAYGSTDYMDVNPGDTITVSGTFQRKAGSYTDNSFRVHLFWRSSDGSSIAATGWFPIIGTNWDEQSTQITVPDLATGVRVALTRNQNTDTANVLATKMSAVRLLDGVLIKDGTLIASKIKAGTISADRIVTGGIDTKRLGSGSVTGISTNTISAFAQTSTSQEVTVTRTIATVTTSADGDGRVVIFLTQDVTGAYMVFAKTQANLPDNYTLDINFRRSTGEVLWRARVEDDGTGGEIQTPGALILFDNPGPGVTVTYQAFVYSFHDDPNGRSSQVDLKRFKAVIMEVKR